MPSYGSHAKEERVRVWGEDAVATREELVVVVRRRAHLVRRTKKEG